MEVTGDEEAMKRWLNEFVPALGCKPIELLGTKEGRELVSTTIDERSTERSDKGSARRAYQARAGTDL